MLHVTCYMSLREAIRRKSCFLPSSSENVQEMFSTTFLPHISPTSSYVLEPGFWLWLPGMLWHYYLHQMKLFKDFDPKKSNLRSMLQLLSFKRRHCFAHDLMKTLSCDKKKKWDGKPVSYKRNLNCNQLNFLKDRPVKQNSYILHVRTIFQELSKSLVCKWRLRGLSGQAPGRELRGGDEVERRGVAIRVF